jgi:multiple sugar transport system substrate-binding protein
MIIVPEFMITPPSDQGVPFSLDLPPVENSGNQNQETIIVPAQGGVPGSIPPEIPVPEPQVDSAQPGTEPLTVPPIAPDRGNPWPKRIIILVILIIFLGIAVVLGRIVLTNLTVPQEVILTYWGLWENDGIIKPLITEFEAKNPKIKVQYSKQSNRQYRERLQAAIERGDGPDIFRYHNTWVPMLKNQLAPIPETVMTVSQFKDAYYPVATGDLVGGQIIYGIPLMIEGLGLYYNEDIFAAAGLTSPPATWEELLALVPKIAKPEGNGFAVSAIALGTTGNIENYSDILGTMFMQNGANLAIPKGKEAEETLAFYHKFANPTDPVYTWNETMDNSMYAFANGKVAMILAPSWRAFDIIEMAKQVNPALKFKIAPIPQLPGNTTTWASYWVEGISEKSKYKKQAAEFMQFLTSRESMIKLYTEESKVRLFGEPYARVDMASLLASDPYVGPFITQAKDARSFPVASRTFDNGLNDRMMKYLENAVNAINTGSSPQQELDTVSSGFSQVLSSYGLVTSTAPTTTN